MFNCSKFGSKLKSLEKEKYYSKILHSKKLPLLVSPLILRKRGCGQVDIASISKNSENFEITIYEVKSSGFITNSQKRRLFNSRSFLADIFKLNTHLEIL